MLFCEKCGKDVEPGEKFCYACRAPVKTSAPPKPDSPTGFCQFCGTRVDATTTVCLSSGKTMLVTCQANLLQFI